MKYLVVTGSERAEVFLTLEQAYIEYLNHRSATIFVIRKVGPCRVVMTK